jgi:HEAT repeat protein
MPALEDNTPEIRRNAAWAISAIGVRGVINVLVEHYSAEPSALVRKHISAAIPRMGLLQLRDLMTDALADENEDIIYSAIWALANTDTGKTSTVLYRILKHSSWRLRLAACRALMQTGNVSLEVVETLQLLKEEPEAIEYDKNSLATAALIVSENMNIEEANYAAEPTIDELIASAIGMLS